MDEELLEALRKEREKKEIMAATKRAGAGGGLMGLVSGIGSSLAGGQKSLAGLARNAATHGLIGAGLGAGSQYIGQNLAGPVGDDEEGGHANRGAFGGAIAGGLGGAALGGLLSTGKLSWLKKAAPLARATLGEHSLDNLAVDQLKKMLAKGQNGRLAAALGIGGAAVGGAHGFEQGVDADYAKTLEDDDEEYR